MRTLDKTRHWEQNRRRISEERHGNAGSVPRQIYRPRVARVDSLPVVRRSASPSRHLWTKWPAEEHDVPPSLHAGTLWDDREGRRESLQINTTAVQTEALSSWLRRPRHGLHLLT